MTQLVRVTDIGHRCQRKTNYFQQVITLDLVEGKTSEEGGRGVECSVQHGLEVWPVVISMWWIRANAGLLWDTVVHSRWRKLKTCNYVFLWGWCSDSQIFIKVHCSRCNYHMLVLIHNQMPALSSPFRCRIHWDIWFSWHTDHHFLLNVQAAVVGWRVAVRALCYSLTYWAIPVNRCLQNLIQESCQYGKQSCLCPSFLTAMKSLMKKSQLMLAVARSS